MTAGVLIGQIARGDSSARQELIALAADRNASTLERGIAIHYLGHGDIESRQAVARQLLDPNRDIRTSAYYSLPKDDQPVDFDYTAQPNDTSERIVWELIGKLK